MCMEGSLFEVLRLEDVERCTPHSLFQREKRTLQRGFSCRCAAIHLLRRARWKRKALFPPKKHLRFFKGACVKRGHSLPETIGPKPREPACTKSGKDRVDQLLFPRSPLRSALPGRSRERQRKEQQGQCDNHPESRTQATNAEKRFSVPKGCSAPQYNQPIHYRTDYNDQSVFSLGPCTARSLFAAAKREWGVHRPSPLIGGMQFQRQ